MKELILQAYYSKFMISDWFNYALGIIETDNFNSLANLNNPHYNPIWLELIKTRIEVHYNLNLSPPRCYYNPEVSDVLYHSCYQFVIETHPYPNICNRACSAQLSGLHHLAETLHEARSARYIEICKIRE